MSVEQIRCLDADDLNNDFKSSLYNLKTPALYYVVQTPAFHRLRSFDPPAYNYDSLLCWGELTLHAPEITIPPMT